MSTSTPITTATPTPVFPTFSTVEEGSAEWNVPDVPRSAFTGPATMWAHFTKTQSTSKLSKSIQANYYVEGVRDFTDEHSYSYTANNKIHTFEAPFKDIYVKVSGTSFRSDARELTFEKSFQAEARDPNFKAFLLSPFHIVILGSVQVKPNSPGVPVRIHLMDTCRPGSANEIGSSDFISFKYGVRGTLFQLVSNALAKRNITFARNGDLIHTVTKGNTTETFILDTYDYRLLHKLLARHRGVGETYSQIRHVSGIANVISSCRMMSLENMDIDPETRTYNGPGPTPAISHLVEQLLLRFGDELTKTTSPRSYKPIQTIWEEHVLTSHRSRAHAELVRFVAFNKNHLKTSVLETKYSDDIIAGITNMETNSDRFSHFKINFENYLKTSIRGKEFFLLSSSAETIAERISHYFKKYQATIKGE